MNSESRDDWYDLARRLDWTFTYVREDEVFPVETSGSPWLPYSAWQEWQEPYKLSCAAYVHTQALKDRSLDAVRQRLGEHYDAGHLAPSWLSAIKLHAAVFALAEFAAVIGNLRAARFGRTAAWRMNSIFAALDETRHTQIPLLLMHELLQRDPQFDWTHRFYHSNNWVAIAARHFSDELLLASNPLEFAVATNFVFETGFTNLQFVGLSALAQQVGDHLFAEMAASIQSDETRHAQIGHVVLAILGKHDRTYAQYLLDKWFWRSWHLFAIVTGFAVDYFTPLAQREISFKEFMQEWVIEQYLQTLQRFGLQRPWYWDIFLAQVESYHHLVYASAYTYRATVWFNLPLPSPEERKWLAEKYPACWPELAPVWEQVERSWQKADVGNEFAVHGTSIIGFCDLCQLVLCGDSTAHNSASTLAYQGRKYIFCSEPCRWIFTQEPQRYAPHRSIVGRVLAGEAPANLIAMLRSYFGLSFATWGKDLCGGNYPWLRRHHENPVEPPADTEAQRA